MVQFLVFFVCAIIGFIIGRGAAHKTVIKWALKSGIDQQKAETLFYLLKNGNKLERQARKEASQKLKDQLVKEQLEKTEKGGKQDG